jgi:GTP-binding protein
MFIDSIKIAISSGNGGSGCSSFRTEKFVPRGGPDGGDGGRGGDVLFVAEHNLDTLSFYKGKKHINADNGKNGGTRKCYGKKGDSLVLKVPLGTQVFDDDENELLLDIDKDGEILFLKGGMGGLGNYHFKSSTNQKPTYCQPGKSGETKNIRLELKLIANVGLVGFPNVGKSTLISVVSNAKPEIQNYEFTTLTPNLGVVKINEWDSFVMADIPGIIDGASEGKGLGIQFLKHIERTSMLLFMVDVSFYIDLDDQYIKLQKELKAYSDVLSKRPFAIAITKIDMVNDEYNHNDFFKKSSIDINDYEYNQDRWILKEDFSNTQKENKPLFIMEISSINQKNIKNLKKELFFHIQNTK